MMRKRNVQLGYALLELLIAIAISAFGMTGLIMLYRGGHETLLIGRASAQLEQGIRKALETMSLEIEETDIASVDVITTPGSAMSFASARQGGAFTVYTDGTPDWKNAVVYLLDTSTNTLGRYVEAKDDWTTNFNTATAFSAGNIEQLVPNVTALAFTLVGTDRVRITLTVQQNILNLTVSDTVTTDIYTRN